MYLTPGGASGTSDGTGAFFRSFGGPGGGRTPASLLGSPRKGDANLKSVKPDDLAKTRLWTLRG